MCLWCWGEVPRGLAPILPPTPVSETVSPELLRRLIAAVRAHGVKVTVTRTNVTDAPRRQGRLVDPILSEVVRSGPVWEACWATWDGPAFSQVTLNRNLTCIPHRDGNNEGDSWVLFFGEFRGGALALEGGTRYLVSGMWHCIPHMMLHWVEPCVGGRWSVVLYRRGRSYCLHLSLIHI